MKDGRLKFCVFRKYKGTVCVYGNLIPDRRKEKRSIDRRKGDRRKLDI